MKKEHELQPESAKDNDSVDNVSRRKAVKTIVGGVGALAAYNMMPSDWSKPLIEQVFLPAHAATSGVSLVDPCTLSVVSGTTTNGPVVIQVNGYVIPRTGGLSTLIVATPQGAGSKLSAKTTTSDPRGTFQAQLTFPDSGITAVTVVTTVDGAAGSATCSVAIPAGGSSEPTTTTTGAPTTTPVPTSTLPPPTSTLPPPPPPTSTLPPPPPPTSTFPF